MYSATAPVKKKMRRNPVKEVYARKIIRDGDREIIDSLIAELGDLVPIQFFARVYTAVDDAGVPNGDFTPQVAATMSYDGLPLFVEHRYGKNPTTDINTQTYKRSLPTASSRPIGRVLSTCSCDDVNVYIKCEVDQSSVTDKEQEMIREWLRLEKIRDVSICFTSFSSSALAQEEIARRNAAGLVCRGPYPCGRAYINLHEVSVCNQGYFPGTNIVAFCASKEEGDSTMDSLTAGATGAQPSSDAQPMNVSGGVGSVSSDLTLAAGQPPSMSDVAAAVAAANDQAMAHAAAAGAGGGVGSSSMQVDSHVVAAKDSAPDPFAGLRGTIAAAAATSAAAPIASAQQQQQQQQQRQAPIQQVKPDLQKPMQASAVSQMKLSQQPATQQPFASTLGQQQQQQPASPSTAPAQAFDQSAMAQQYQSMLARMAELEARLAADTEEKRAMKEAEAVSAIDKAFAGTPFTHIAEDYKAQARGATPDSLATILASAQKTYDIMRQQQQQQQQHQQQQQAQAQRITPPTPAPTTPATKARPDVPMPSGRIPSLAAMQSTLAQQSAAQQSQQQPPPKPDPEIEQYAAALGATNPPKSMANVLNFGPQMLESLRDYMNGSQTVTTFGQRVHM
jgi:hypothetical protein